ncbi:vWA domain-containing protein [Halorarius halobius]|uniref:vWA domain-containing protein n=1 Tax=Halorarius halobius TaxID=2962671 RepID=UPI0020CECDC1|nr:VWA domain-containing protein [Halorarius halobius]
MAALQELFATPLGLLALAAVVPLVLLYLVRPDPRRLRLPTVEFLTEGEGTASDSPALARLKRSLVLLVQILLVAAVALALAGPYVTVARETSVAETVVVVDTSASMTVGDGETRFDRALAEAREAVTETTSVVTAGARPRVRLRGGGPPDAREALDEVTTTDAPGDLSAAIRRAAAVAGPESRVVVVSDFAGVDGWRETVATARARGLTVELRPVGESVDNVGIVAAEYGRTSVTLSVQNYGDEQVTRRVGHGNATRTLELAPGDAATVTLPVPAGETRIRLSGSDAFPVDDTLYVAGPDTRTVDVLVVTNDEDRNFLTALRVLDEVDVTVKNPPTTVGGDYDVVVFGSVAPDRLLRSTVESAGDVARSGGGVVVTAQSGLGAVAYRDLLPLRVTGNASNPSVRVRSDRLTRGISFPPPNEYVTAELTRGAAVVRADGSPLVARAGLGDGRVLYYGYPPDSSFRYNYQFPVFWKRVVYETAGRDPLPATNREAGTTLEVSNDTTVRGPDGETTGPTSLDAVGFYRYGDQRVGVSLLDRAESNVSAPDLSADADGPVRERTETRQVPKDLSMYPALAAVLLVVCEVGLLRYRGDL